MWQTATNDKVAELQQKHKWEMFIQANQKNLAYTLIQIHALSLRNLSQSTLFDVLIFKKIIILLFNCSMQEGVCILSGLGYRGRGEDGQPQWDACANMRVWLFETTPLFTGTINSFNINTNAWVARYTTCKELSDCKISLKSLVYLFVTDLSSLSWCHYNTVQAHFQEAKVLGK